MKNITVSTITLLMLSLTACGPTIKPGSGADLLSARTYVSYEVEFQPNTGPPMITTTPGPKCARGVGSKPGCMRFNTDEYGSILFALTVGPDGEKCGRPGVSWVITKVEAAETGNINTGKSTAWGASLSTRVRNDFYPMDDPDHGVLIDTDWKAATNTAGLMNRNISDTAYDLWYKITATKCPDDDSDELETNWSDPRIENEGR